jgi:hypothetical protein
MEFIQKGMLAHGMADKFGLVCAVGLYRRQHPDPDPGNEFGVRRIRNPEKRSVASDRDHIHCFKTH